MFILMGKMLTNWLTHIISSLCSRLVSYCVQSSSTQHPSSSPSDMVFKSTRSLSLTSHAYKLALTRPLLPQPWPCPTLGHFHKMATSFATRDCSMSPTIRMSNWTSFTPITTTTWLDTLVSPRQSRVSIHVWSAIAAITSNTSPLALIISCQLVNDLGTQSQWI